MLVAARRTPLSLLAALAACLLSASLALASVEVRVVDDLDWAAQSGTKLTRSAAKQLEWAVCEDHFPPGSEVWNQLVAAAATYSEAPGVDIDIALAPVPHRDKDELFAVPPIWAGSFDYVDNAADPTPHGCKPNNPTACGGGPGFVMNCCHFKESKGEWGAGTARSDAFVISANANCYAHDTDLSSPDHPKAGGVTHELGHVFGLVHGNGRPDEDKALLTVMSQGLSWLAAYDLAHLAAHYGSEDPVELAWLATPDWIVSDALRLDDGKGGPLKTTFSEHNPTDLYIDGDELLDCATEERPIFTAQIQDTSTATPAGVPVLAQLDVAAAATGWDYLPLLRELLPASYADGDLAQLTWLTDPPLGGGVLFPRAWLSSWPPPETEPALVRVRVDPSDLVAERSDDDNFVEATITLHRRALTCP